eukprot:gene6411-7067_t
MEFLAEEYEGKVVCLGSQLKCIRRLMTTLRAKDTDHPTFVRSANRLMTLLCEEGLSHVQEGLLKKDVETPTETVYQGEALDTSNLVVISIIRAGDAMLDNFLRLYPEVQAGKILIQRNEETTQPMLYYHKLPKLEGRQIIILDPMLATGGSAKMAIRTLKEFGALEERITFLNVISCPEGIKSMLAEFPKVVIVTGEIDPGLNEKAYIVPGLGDYGDRYFGTTA